MNSYIQHHGIKGQKWGIRRFQNKDGSLTAKGRQRYGETTNKREETPEERKKRISRNVAIGAAATATALTVIGAMYIKHKYDVNIKELNKKATSSIKEIRTKPIDLNSLSDKDTVISKGTKFQRISSRKIEDYSEAGKQIYASYLKNDNAIYMHDMPKNIEQWRRSGIIKDEGSKIYKHLLETNKDVKVASPRKMVEAYMAVTGDTECKQYRYQNFITGLVDRDKPENKKFISKLVEMGYNAIIDENDAGSYTKSPLILLDPSKDVSGIKTTEIKKIHKILNVLKYER